MKTSYTEMVELSRRVHTLRHIETAEYICLRHNSKEYMVCFSDGDSACQFREELGLIEHVDIAVLLIGEAPFEQFWLDGEMIGRGALVETTAHVR